VRRPRKAASRAAAAPNAPAPMTRTSYSRSDRLWGLRCIRCLSAWQRLRCTFGAALMSKKPTQRERLPRNASPRRPWRC